MKIKQNQMNDVIFKVCFVAQYVKALLQTPGLHEEGMRLFLPSILPFVGYAVLHWNSEKNLIFWDKYVEILFV